jgi:hypothetical protein
MLQKGTTLIQRHSDVGIAIAAPENTDQTLTTVYKKTSLCLGNKECSTTGQLHTYCTRCSGKNARASTAVNPFQVVPCQESE